VALDDHRVATHDDATSWWTLDFGRRRYNGHASAILDQVHPGVKHVLGTPNTSPFCAKLETYLRITETPYTTAPFKRSQMPKGKIPYVELDGAFVGDSQLIIEELERRLGAKALDVGLGAADRALSRMVRRTLVI
jgi:hypothetical protein